MIRIMKASAGSGKTFNLAKTYIRLLLSQEDRRAYRHILAVTFTNKATEEMKSRILKELYILSKDTESSPYATELIPLVGTVEDLRKRASMALCDILHDYGAFAISTIDRFFQQTLKAFSREIGQFSSYQVELDTKSLVDESVDRVLDSLSEDDPALLKWLTQSVMEDLQQGNRYNLEKKLKDVAFSLKSDEHRAMVEKWGVDEAHEYSKENLSAMKRALSAVVASFRKDLIAKAQAFAQGCLRVGLDSSDFAGTSFNAVFRYAETKPADKIKPPTDTVRKRCEDFASWFRKSDVARHAHLEGELLPLLRDICDHFDKNFRVFNTALTIQRQLNELGIAGDLFRELKSLLKEKNVISIDDSNVILRNIIDGSDAPFVYEKLGVRYEHFLLDEFQDTSRIQWDNFRPLVKESNSNDHENLLVGDVKQSIYRWRGSDWKMMAGDVQDELSGCTIETLDSNYRSLQSIVDFNNGFFAYAARTLDSMLGEHDGLSVESIYSDASQLVKSKDRSEGSVEAIFCKPDSELDAVLDAVREVLDRGARAGDITILVRKNQQGSEIALHLMKNGISVISDDSLHLKASPVVRQVVSLLSSVGDSEDSVGSYLASEMGVDFSAVRYLSLLDLCESLLRVVKARDEALFASQTQYVQSFMDFVQDHASVNGNTIEAFLGRWMESDPKISSPADPDSVRVMTIHKSKGLEFEHVIVPQAEKTTLFESGSHWARPDVDGTSLSGVVEGVYNVHLSQPKNDSTLFSKECFKEMYLQYIDNINTFYVALTRAVRGLTVISSLPSDKCREAAAGGSGFEFGDFSQILYHYLYAGHSGLGFEMEDTGEVISFRKGTPCNYSDLERRHDPVGNLTPGYPSIPLNPDPVDEDSDVRERGRLKFSADSVDFFCDEARASVSARLNGTVMHDILSNVRVPSDLPGAVSDAVRAGDIDAADEEACLASLSAAVSSHPEWFSEDLDAVYSEVSLVDTDGREYRPDRVVSDNGSLTVIDYKFGEKDPRYRKQVERYADIYRRMGFEVAKTVVWYVPDNVVE